MASPEKLVDGAPTFAGERASTNWLSANAEATVVTSLTTTELDRSAFDIPSVAISSIVLFGPCAALPPSATTYTTCGVDGAVKEMEKLPSTSVVAEPSEVGAEP